MASYSKSAKVMKTRVSVLGLLQAVCLGGDMVLAAGPESLDYLGKAASGHCTVTSTGGEEEDWFSLLQVSATEPARSRQQKLALDGLGESVSSHMALGPRHTELQLQISQARATLALMEAEVAKIESAGSATQDSFSALSVEAVVPYVIAATEATTRSSFGADKGSHDMRSVDKSDGALANFIATRCPHAVLPTLQGVDKSKMSLLQTIRGSDEDSMNPLPSATTLNDFEAVDLSWRGMESAQIPTSESHVSGHKCQKLHSVHKVGGPAALPNILANTVVLYQQAGYEGSKLRDMVSSELSKQLSDGGSTWNVVAGIFDWNLYNEATEACTIAVKFSPTKNDPDWYSDWMAFGT